MVTFLDRPFFSMDLLSEVLTIGRCPLLAFSDIERDQVYETLQKHFHNIRWTQVTVAFCSASNLQNLTPNSILSFDGQANIDEQQYSIRSQILFVHYFPNGVLCVFGALSHARYTRLQEQGFVQISDLETLTPPAPPSSLSQTVLDIAPYYNFSDTYNLQSCRELLWRGNESLYKFRKYDSLRNVAGAREAFPLALFSAAASPLFEHRFVQREIEILLARLGCLTTEEERLAFVEAWFGEKVLNITVYHGGAVAHAEEGIVPGLRLPETTLKHTRESIVQLRKFHNTHYPSMPTPSFVFYVDISTVPALMAPACPRCRRSPCVRLPVERGKVVLTHLELDLYLPALWKQRYEEMVFTMQLSGACYLSDHWARPASEKVQLAEEARYFHEAAKALREHFSPVLLEEVLIPTFYDATDNWNWYFDWNFDQLTTSEDTTVSVSGDLPTTRDQLIEYAQRYWPPCMQALVELCKGHRHLQHEERIKMAALLRVFGYSPAQAEQLWWNLFRETLANTHYVTQEAFLEGEHGQVIINDYKANKQRNVGVHCESLIRKKLCPFVETGDIEDLVSTARKHCTESLQKYRASKGLRELRYPIYSPKNYFTVQTKYQ